jgi:hypothetical protein
MTTHKSRGDTVRQLYRRIGTQGFTGIDMRQDVATREDTFQHDLHPPAGRLGAKHTRWNHTRVVEYQQIVGFQ